MSEEEAQEPRHKRGDRWFLWFIFVIFLIGLGIRVYGYMNPTPEPSGERARSRQSRTLQSPLTDSRTPQVSVEGGEPSGTDWAAALAPYLTEGGLSFFIGFCIGYFLRVVAKAVIFVVGGLYIALILLSHYGMVTVDWGSVQHLLQQLLLNARTHAEGLQGLLTVGIPSVAMGSLGIWRGMKKPF